MNVQHFVSVRLGTAAWGRARGGRLTFAEQWRFAMQTAVTQLRFQWRQLSNMSDAKRVGWSRLEPDQIHLPDSPVVTRAVEWIEQCEPLWLQRHSLRTWAWAALLAQRDALHHDPEVLAISSLLHDIALTIDSRSDSARVCACFAVDGGEQAREFLIAQGWSKSRAHAVDDAICLHMNPQVPSELGIEAHLLQRAAALDVVGANMGQIDAQSRKVVLARYPRTDFVPEMTRAMREQVDRSFQTRTAMLWRLGLERAIRRSGWDE